MESRGELSIRHRSECLSDNPSSLQIDMYLLLVAAHGAAIHKSVMAKVEFHVPVPELSAENPSRRRSKPVCSWNFSSMGVKPYFA